ncbi:mitochondrial 2-oxodicarboxylate carrier [Contarinia nasturtii]|uniref:mitochondrial 2-oxodicarboxylate carrier n=1 Tax=Contarinia nasturtii TaxID=265458 RepID=UPI0012D4B50E|nr:mitochondrial 2-oxodicarboxylate carrier [Contarinia nasturtii]
MSTKNLDNTKQSLLKQAGLQIIAGGSAGFVEVCLMHPLDLVKTRLQIQNKINNTASSELYYKGVLDCFRKMLRNEGLFSFWKGIVPPILAETPKRATKFLCFEQYKKIFMFGSDKATPQAYSLAGLGAGATEAVIVNSFEVVKVTLQSNRAKSTEIPSTFSVARNIIKTEGFGLQGLNKGLTATIARNGVFNMIYFGFYHSVKDYFPAYEEPMKEFIRKVGIGFTSGTIASFANIPFDVAKSRIQGPQPVSGQIKYRTTCGTLLTVAREEGFSALYKGLLPKVMRLGPGGAIMLLMYEFSYDYLQQKFL